MVGAHGQWHLPAKRQDLNLHVTHAEHGKPVASPMKWAGQPRGRLTGLRVKEGGGSECRSVVGRIGVEVEHRHHPTRKRADFRSVLHHESSSDAPTESGAEERPLTHARPGSTFAWRDMDSGQRGPLQMQSSNASQPYRGTIARNGFWSCLLYTSPSPRDLSTSRMPSSA